MIGFEKYNNLEYSDKYKNEVLNFINNLLKKYGIYVHSDSTTTRLIYVQTELQIIYLIIIYSLYTTKIGSGILKCEPKLKKVVEDRIIYFQNNKPFIYVVDFFTNNFETGKRYILKKKNKEYRKRITRLYLITIYRFYTIFKKKKR